VHNRIRFIMFLIRAITWYMSEIKPQSLWLNINSEPDYNSKILYYTPVNSPTKTGWRSLLNSSQNTGYGHYK